MDGNDEIYGSLYGNLFPELNNISTAAASIPTVNTSAGDALWSGRGFIPGQDNGDWKWQPWAGALLGLDSRMAVDRREAAANAYENAGRYEFNPNAGGDSGLNNYAFNPMFDAPIEQRKTYDQLHPMTEDDKWLSDIAGSLNPKGSGTWFNDKDPYNGLDYRPTTGYNMTAYDSAPTGMRKYMPALTMAVMGAMSGGAAMAAMPAGAGALGSAAAGAASAAPSAMRSGLNTGDWGNALTSLGMGALGGGLSTFGTNPLTKGLINAGVSTAGKAATGQKVDGTSILSDLVSGVGSNYLGNYAGNAAGGGLLGDIVKGTTGSLSNAAIKSLMEGKTPSEQEMIMRLLSGIVRPVANAIL
jgi:hypothetical protein